MTEWFHEDDVCWIAECEICAVPMVVWRFHGTEPPEEHRTHMMEHLAGWRPGTSASTTSTTTCATSPTTSTCTPGRRAGSSATASGASRRVGAAGGGGGRGGLFATTARRAGGHDLAGHALAFVEAADERHPAVGNVDVDGRGVTGRELLVHTVGRERVAARAGVLEVDRHRLARVRRPPRSGRTRSRASSIDTPSPPASTESPSAGVGAVATGGQAHDRGHARRM